MIRTAIFAAAAATLTSTAALAAVEAVKDVEVTVDLAAVKNARAAAYWANLSTDLTNAISARVADRAAEEGATIKVDIREVELANSFERAFNAAEAMLVGQVNVWDPTDGLNEQAYEMKISLEGATMVDVNGNTVTFTSIDTPEAYTALVNGFADGVVNNLK